MALSDEQLIRSARTGEAAAFGSLVERHFGLVYSIALAHLTERETAEDLAQEVFLRAFLNIDRLDQPRRFPTWLASITRNLAISWLRRRQRSSRLVAMVPLDTMGQDPADTQVKGVSTAMQEQEESAALREALETLKPRERELVLLHFAEGLKKAEIAERMGVHPATVGRHIERALRSMRGAMERTLREGLPTMRAPSAGIVRTITLITAASAMSGAAKATLAGAAQASVPALATAGSLGTVGKLTATLAAGGKIMATGKGIAATVVAVAAISGGVYLNTGGAPVPHEEPAAPGVAEQSEVTTGVRASAPVAPEIAQAVEEASRGLFRALEIRNWDQAQRFFVTEADLGRLMQIPDGSDDLQDVLENQRQAFERCATQLNSFQSREFLHLMENYPLVERVGVRMLDNVRWRVRLDGREWTVRADEMILVDGRWLFLSPPDRIVPDSQSDAASRACQENLAHLDGATEQLALDQRKPPGATVPIADLVGPTSYLRRVPVCPSGGTYGSSAGPNFFTVGETPTCSHGGAHVLP